MTTKNGPTFNLKPPFDGLQSQLSPILVTPSPSTWWGYLGFYGIGLLSPDNALIWTIMLCEIDSSPFWDMNHCLVWTFMIEAQRQNVIHKGFSSTPYEKIPCLLEMIFPCQLCSKHWALNTKCKHSKQRKNCTAQWDENRLRANPSLTKIWMQINDEPWVNHIKKH